MAFRDVAGSYDPDHLEIMRQAYDLTVEELKPDEPTARAIAEIILKHFKADPTIGATALAEIAFKEIHFDTGSY